MSVENKREVMSYTKWMIISFLIYIACLLGIGSIHSFFILDKVSKYGSGTGTLLAGIAAMLTVIFGFPGLSREWKKNRDESSKVRQNPLLIQEIEWLKRGIMFINSLNFITNLSITSGLDFTKQRAQRIKECKKELDHFLNEFDLIHLYVKEDLIPDYEKLRSKWIDMRVGFDMLITMGWPDHTDRLDYKVVKKQWENAFLIEKGELEQAKNNLINEMKRIRNSINGKVD